jgi:hypothetical protein
MFGEEQGARFEHGCYDLGRLYNLAYFVERKLVKLPLFVQTIFGILGRIGADMRNMMFMKETADRLFVEYRTSVLAADRSQSSPRHTGGHDGRECSGGTRGTALYQSRQARGVERRAGHQDATNLKELGRSISTPTEAREIPALKGEDNVGF